MDETPQTDAPPPGGPHAVEGVLKEPSILPTIGRIVHYIRKNQHGEPRHDPQPAIITYVYSPWRVALTVFEVGAVLYRLNEWLVPPGTKPGELGGYAVWPDKSLYLDAVEVPADEAEADS